MSLPSNFDSDSLSRQELISQTEECFEQANYKLSKIENSSCIDIIAEPCEEIYIDDQFQLNRTNLRIFLKVLGNLNTFKDKQSKDIRLLSFMGGGVPLIIASRYSKNRLLEHGIVYTRYTISSINVTTLETLLKNNISPSEIAIRGKNQPLVSINGLELEKMLKSLVNFSQIEICQKLNISRQSLIAYQKETIKPTLSKYQELLTFLGENLIENDLSEIDKKLRKPISLFLSDNRNIEINNPSFSELDSVNNNELKVKINKHLEKLKFNKFWFQSLPWDGLITYRDNKSHFGHYSNDDFIKKVFTGVVDNQSDFDFHKKRLEKSSKVFDFLNQKAIWLIDSDEITSIDEENISSKNIFIMPTEVFFDIKESRKLKRKFNDTLEEKNKNE